MATAPVAAPDPRKLPRRPALHVAGSARYPVVYYDQQIDNSYLEPVLDPAEGRRLLRVASVCVCAFMIVFGLLVVHVTCRHYGYEIARLQAESAQLKVSNQKYELELARLSDPQRIDRLARQDLGFEPSKPQQVVRLGSADPEAQPAIIPVVAHNFETLGPPRRGEVREP